MEKNWKGTWTQEDFYKPKFELPGLKHELWKCPFCRASFDRFRPDGSGLQPEVKTMTIGELLGTTLLNIYSFVIRPKPYGNHGSSGAYLERSNLDLYVYTYPCTNLREPR